MMGEVIRVSGRAPDVGDLLREAMVSQRFTDVALCCSGGQRFLAHRLVLSAASPYLQEVLLAHGKAAGYCEPITVILAEVEGPELAAILGFVYTGSATVPRSRLEAFTRAAETLHVRIPPLTVPNFKHHRLHHNLGSTRVVEECKLDNVKIEETKIDSRYLRCEQYPSYDKWFNTTSWSFDGCLERVQRGEWMLTAHDRLPQTIHRSNEDVSRNIRYQPNFVESDLCHRNEKIHLPDTPAAGPGISNNLPIVDSFADPLIRGSRSEDGSYELHRRGPNTTRIIPGVDHEPRLDPFLSSDNSVSRINGWEVASSRHDETPMKLQHEGEIHRDNNDFEGRLVAESRSVPSLPMVHHTTGRSSVTFEKQDYDSAAAASGPPEAVGTLSTPSATVTSSIATDATISRTTTCGESCCRWRSPRRHVANRVPASPWSQIARPAHNSPKIRPIVFRNREDSSETFRLRWNEAGTIRAKRTSPFPTQVTFGDNQRETSPSGPLNLHDETAESDCGVLAPPYGFQVPKATEIPSSIDANIRFVDYVDRRQPSPDFYDAGVYQRPRGFPVATISPVIEQFSTSIPPKETLRMLEKCESATGLFEDATNSRLRPVQECSNGVNINETLSGSGQLAISPEGNQQIVNDQLTCNRRTSPRVELSHPISRLCDSIRLIGEITEQEQCFVERNNATGTVKETVEINAEDTRIFAGKPMFPIAGGIIQSDSNNNEATVDCSILSTNPPPSSSGDSVETTTGNEGVGNSEDHRCELCGKTFVTRASLKVHGRTHSGEKPFRCTDCGKEFSQLRNYKYHRSVHEGTREFAATCPECGKYFNDRGYLSSHMKIHRNRKEYACTECGKSFNQRVAYNMHVRIHTGVKPHQCEQCGKAFSRKMLLKQHLRTHSGERPYQCQICHKAFADRSNMTLHTRLHSGLKPYQCTLCSKAFTKKHHLKTHLNYHTGTKPYSCPNCALRFSQSSNMRTHYKKCSVASSGSVSQHSSRGDDDNRPERLSSAVTIVAEGDDDKAPPSTPGRTSALTPPSSDQESSILTPMSEERCKSTRVYPALRSKDTGTSIPDT